MFKQFFKKIGKEIKHNFFDFLLIYSIFFGLLLGIGYIIIGTLRYQFILTFIGFIGIIFGLISIPFLKNEKDYI